MPSLTAYHLLFLAAFSATVSIGVSQVAPALPVQDETLALASNSTTSPAAASTGSSARVLHWQSAYWSLVALGLNAMTQASGADRHLVTATLSPARSSPLVCIADVVVMLVWTVSGVRRGDRVLRSLGVAAHYVMAESTADSTTTSSSTNGFENGIPAVGLIFFVLAPLPQFIKLCGMTGVPLTQTMGAAYMAAYLLSAFASNCPKPGSPVEAATESTAESPGLKPWEIRRLQKLTHIIYGGAIALQCLLWIALVLVLAIVSINTGVSYLAGFLTMALFAIYGCTLGFGRQNDGLRPFFAVMFVATFMLLLMQANIEEESGGSPFLRKPRNGFAWFVFSFYQWLGNVLLMGGMIIVVVMLCSSLIDLLNNATKSLPLFIEKHSKSKSATPHKGRVNDQDVEMNAQIPTPAAYDTNLSLLFDPDQTADSAADNSQENTTIDTAAMGSGDMSSKSQLVTENTLSTEDFAKWLEQEDREIGQIGEWPANPRPYGFPLDNLPGIRRAKDRGDPYWAAFAGGPATSPPPGTVYLSAAQIEVIHPDAQKKEIEEKRSRSATMSVAFAITNMVIGLLCYVYKYNAQGTSKPSWTELLG